MLPRPERASLIVRFLRRRLTLGRSRRPRTRPIDTKQGTIKVETVAARSRITLGASPSCPTAACSSRRSRDVLRIVAKDGNISEPHQRRARGLRARPRRPARRGARSRFRREQPRLSLLSPSPAKAAGRHRCRARQARRRRPRRCPGHLPAKAQGRRRQPFRLAACLRPRRQAVRHARRALQVRAGARPRRRISARSCASIPTARCPTTIPSSARRASCRRSGPTATATRKAPPFTPRPASCGRRNSARSAATSSTFRKPARTTAGRW